MTADFIDDTIAALFSFFHTEHAGWLLKYNSTEHLVKKKKRALYSIPVYG